MSCAFLQKTMLSMRKMNATFQEEKRDEKFQKLRIPWKWENKHHVQNVKYMVEINFRALAIVYSHYMVWKCIHSTMVVVSKIAIQCVTIPFVVILKSCKCHELVSTFSASHDDNFPLQVVYGDVQRLCLLPEKVFSYNAWKKRQFSSFQHIKFASFMQAIFKSWEWWDRWVAKENASSTLLYPLTHMHDKFRPLSICEFWGVSVLLCVLL